MKKILLLVLILSSVLYGVETDFDFNPSEPNLSLGDPKDPNHWWRAAISRIWNLTDNGFLKTSDNNGVLIVDTNTPLLVESDPNFFAWLSSMYSTLADHNDTAADYDSNIPELLHLKSNYEANEPDWSHLKDIYESNEPRWSHISDNVEANSVDWDSAHTTQAALDALTGYIVGNAGSYKADANTHLISTTNFGGDVSGTYDNIAVVDDSHNHVYSNIDSTTSANFSTVISDISGTTSGKFVLVNIATLGKNDTIKWTGSQWRDANTTDTYTFSIASFSDGITTTQEIGSGTWKAIGALTFIATYNNGPPDATPYIVKSSSGGTNAWSSNLNMTTSPAFEGPTTNTEIVTHRTSVGTITFTLYAQVGAETSNVVETVTFWNKRHWGVTTKTSGWDSADIGNLANNELSNSKAKTFSVTAGAGEYILYCYPSRLTTATFTVGGFEGGFENPATVSRTNTGSPSSFVENYYVYRSSNANLGTVTVVAQ